MSEPRMRSMAMLNYITEKSLSHKNETEEKMTVTKRKSPAKRKLQRNTSTFLPK